MSDQATTVADLRQLVSQFVSERDWQQFHAPKNLVMALAVEASELMEHFQWITVDQSRKVADDAERLQAVGEELADVICYALALANELNLDVSSTLRDKMKKNVRKYPASEFRGRYKKEDRPEGEPP